MKFTPISRAVFGLCAIASAPAFALTSTAYTNTDEVTGDTLNIRISGATAVDPGIIASAIFLCDTVAQIDRYSINNNAVLFCQIDQAKLPGTGKTNLAVYKYSIGGSGGGVANVNNATLIPFIDLTKLAANCNAGTNVTNPADLDGTNPLPTFVDTLCAGASNNTATTTTAVSSIGISDVEPNFFGLAAGVYDNLAPGALATVLFGAPVTQNAYIALQKAQGLSTAGGGTCALDEQTIAGCIPSLSQAQLTSMYTQPTQTWPKLTGATILLADNVTVSSNQGIYVARRANTSGTQKTYEALIARTNNTSTGGRFCQPSVEAFVVGPNATDNTTANTLCGSGTNQSVRNSGSNQVLVCMNAHDLAGRGAIGTLSLEYKQTLANNVRFTKINGILPTYAGVASGSYTFYGDVSLNQRVAAVGSVGGTQSLPGYPAYITALRANFANPATIEIINGSNQPFGPSGLMALDALQTVIPVADFTGATARNPWSRLVGGSVLNNCQPGKAAKL